MRVATAPDVLVEGFDLAPLELRVI